VHGEQFVPIKHLFSFSYSNKSLVENLADGVSFDFAITNALKDRTRILQAQVMEV
jgi:hypothetical protein